ncbi:MAG: tetratricopeptide repeat protein [Deltaproteobacteria bacterium]|nr:tetratricopeptide repeat protein [Deltaproteobacteria bacterium]
MTRTLKYIIMLICVNLVLLLAGLAFAENFEAKQAFERGQFEFQDDNNAEALKFFDRALQLDPNNLDYQYFRGLTLAKLKRSQEAVDTLIKVLEADPEGRKSLLVEIGNIYSASKDYKNALLYFDKALAAFPNRADIYMNRGLVYLGQNDYSRAEKEFNKVTEIDPKLEAFALFHLALASFQKDDLVQAKDRLNRAIATKPDDALLKSCRGFLANIEKEEKRRKPLSVLAVLILQYDDNVNNQPLVPAGIIPGTATGRSDWSTGLNLKASYHLINRRVTRLGVSYAFISNLYQSLTQNDLLSHMISGFYQWSKSPISFRLVGDAALYIAAGDHRLNTYTITPSLTYVLNQSNRFAFTGLAQYRVMLDNTPNSLYFTATGIFYHDFALAASKVLTLRGGASYEYDNPVGNTLPAYKIYEALAGITFPAIREIVTDLGASYGSAKFQAPSTREDLRWEVALKITRNFFTNFQTMFMWTYIHNDSNLVNPDPFEYKRNVYTFLVTGFF